MGRAPDFLDSFLYCVGESEIPKQFFLWSCLSLLAACVQDRVGVVRHGEVLSPNLYVFLIGPSGTGKDKAINAAVRYVNPDLIPEVNAVNIRGTAPYIIDRLGKRQRNPRTGRIEVPNPKIYFVLEELNASIREGELAHDFISIITKLYCKQEIPFTEGTRKGGQVMIMDPCINILAGSTPEWLLRSLSKDAIEGGALARILAIHGRRNYEVRIPHPIIPSDRDEVEAALAERVQQYIQLAGAYELSKEAQKAHGIWYMTRPEPGQQEEEPAWCRADEMVHKLATLLALCEWDGVEEPSWLIESRHLKEAIELYGMVQAGAPAITRLASATVASRQVDAVRECIKRVGTIDHSALTRKMGGRGLVKFDIARAIASLLDEGVIEIGKTETGLGRMYKWVGEGE